MSITLKSQTEILADRMKLIGVINDIRNGDYSKIPNGASYAAQLDEVREQLNRAAELSGTPRGQAITNTSFLDNNPDQHRV
ncbi:MAG: hypothetical protein H6861_09310 [Rhodospirillales bacterium]|nr:hypothetical protein [Rhodospirillales bacterium]